MHQGTPCPDLLKDITKHFGDFKAVDDVNLTVPHGTFVCLLGPSGCGKTTLLRMIAGLEEPTAGAILLDGAGHHRRADAQAQSRHGVPVAGAVSASHRRRQHRLSAAHPRRRQGRAAPARRRAAEDGPSCRACRPARWPSSPAASGSAWRSPGRSRISPKLFLLDEPLSALDAKLREAMQVELRQLQQQLGITTIVVTHDQREAMTMADLVVVMGQRQDPPGGAADRDLPQARPMPSSPISSARPTCSRSTPTAPAAPTVLGQPRCPASSLPAGSSARHRCRSGRRTCISAARRRGAVAGTVTFVRDLGGTIETFVEAGGATHRRGRDAARAARRRRRPERRRRAAAEGCVVVKP